MIQKVSKITAVTAMVVMISSLAASLAWGGVILIFFGGLIAAPFILIGVIRSKWDSGVEEVDSAAMVAHRNSTAVAYATKKAVGF